MAKETVLVYLNTFIPEAMFPSCRDLDGTAARKFLEANGFTVIKNFDTGRNGLAVTSEGYALSTNGYFDGVYSLNTPNWDKV